MHRFQTTRGFRTTTTGPSIRIFSHVHKLLVCAAKAIIYLSFGHGHILQPAHNKRNCNDCFSWLAPTVCLTSRPLLHMVPRPTNSGRIEEAQLGYASGSHTRHTYRDPLYRLTAPPDSKYNQRRQRLCELVGISYVDTHWQHA